ncbi:hypothetical protein T265_01061 [Opisthorchis viverrini]|uniref:Uncharacterized protein n=1 Tax=Opisthorchis viverrini TaxID=6198 RepID=A0A075AAX6_OPIVI|nr:hypothetical protein T265_01061 [Opisthorchis viverrini]KER32970.1 hypothetical protein T265_01061 [Opisthorchis viverrini]
MLPTLASNARFQRTWPYVTEKSSQADQSVNASRCLELLASQSTIQRLKAIHSNYTECLGSDGTEIISPQHSFIKSACTAY